MEYSNTTIIIIICICIIVFLLFICLYSNSQNTDQSKPLPKPRTAENFHYDGTYDITDYDNNYESGDIENIFTQKTKNKNQAKKNSYKKSSYVDGERSKSNEKFDKYYDDNNNIFKDNGLEGGCATYLNSDVKYSSFECAGNNKLSDEELMNSNNFLPQSNNDLFDNPPETINVKSNNLINIHRPMPLNTTSSSTKGQSHDLRGDITNPKFLASPWNNSTIEPSIYNNNLCK